MHEQKLREETVNQPENLSHAGHDCSLFPGPDDPPRDWGEGKKLLPHAIAARRRLLRDHLGKFAVIHQDVVAAVFMTPSTKPFWRATAAKPGDVPIISGKEIMELPDFVGIVDLNHPSIRFVDR